MMLSGECVMSCHAYVMPFKENWNVDAASELSKTEREHLDKLVIFSNGDEQRQIIWFHCLDFNTLNEETGEVDILDFDQDDLWHASKRKSAPCITSGFDVHMQRLANKSISDLLRYFS